MSAEPLKSSLARAEVSREGARPFRGTGAPPGSRPPACRGQEVTCGLLRAAAGELVGIFGSFTSPLLFPVAPGRDPRFVWGAVCVVGVGRVAREPVLRLLALLLPRPNAASVFVRLLPSQQVPCS